MNTYLVHNKKIDVSLAELTKLAAKGLSHKDIAKKLSMSETTFRHRMNQRSFFLAWKKGAVQAGMYKERCNKAVAELENDLPVKDQDYVVLEALFKNRHRGQTLPVEKRAATIRNITGMDLGSVVKSLERLVANQYATVEEGLIFTLYKAVVN